MFPRYTRRALLRVTATAGTAGLAGCYFGPTDPREPNGTPDESDGPSGSGNADGDGGGSAGDGGSTGDTTPQSAGRTFTFELENSITSDRLEKVDGVAADTPAQVLVDVEVQYDDREEAAYERTIELQPGEQRTLADVFTTEEGPEYVIRTKLEGRLAEENDQSFSRGEGYRFTPGGFGGPTGTTFEVSVVAAGEGDEFVPMLSMQVQE